jgi:uncharacterized phiE125 gp8 family phage protein
MHVEVVTPPAEVVSLEEAKKLIVVEHDEDDELIQAAVTAATQVLDGPNGYLRRAIGAQKLSATLYEWPCRPLLLPYPPIVAVEAISYLDVNGAGQTVDAATYQLLPGGRLQLAYGMLWPNRRSCRDPITIRYTAGWAIVPLPIVQAIKMQAADFYANRGESALATLAFQPNPAIARLLAPYRIHRL